MEVLSRTLRPLQAFDGSPFTGLSSSPLPGHLRPLTEVLSETCCLPHSPGCLRPLMEVLSEASRFPHSPVHLGLLMEVLSETYHPCPPQAFDGSLICVYLFEKVCPLKTEYLDKILIKICPLSTLDRGPLKDRQGVSAPAKHHSQTLGNPVFKITKIYVSNKPRKP